MDDMKEYANIALNSAHRLHNQLSSIRHFLTTSTLAHPGNECPLTHIPQLIAALCEEMEIRTFHISEIVEMKSHLCVVLSEQAISLLLRQVLENARKFHPQQTPTVEIILKQVSPREFCIQVCDDGITLSSEQLVRVWVPYYQAEKSFSGQVPGMGLGLAIVAMLLWSVGGHYHICNRDPGPGVVIDMVIPLTDHGG
jgi:signal transduction histidine kinase